MRALQLERSGAGSTSCAPASTSTRLDCKLRLTLLRLTVLRLCVVALSKPVMAGPSHYTLEEVIDFLDKPMLPGNDNEFYYPRLDIIHIH